MNDVKRVQSYAVALITSLVRSVFWSVSAEAMTMNTWHSVIARNALSSEILYGRTVHCSEKKPNDSISAQFS